MLKGKRLWYVLLAAVVLIAAVVVLVIVLLDDDDESDTYTIGIVNIAPVLDPVVDGFKEGMTVFEYGDNVTYLYEGAVSRDEQEAKLQEMVDQEVDLLVTLTTPVTVSAKTITAGTGIPVVFVPVTDPLAAGIVSELAHPGENITGIISGSNEPKRLEWLLDVAPDANRILYPYNPNDSSPVNTLAELEVVAADLEIELIPLEIADADALQALIDDLPDDIDAIFLPPDSLIGSLYPQWVEASIARQLPISGSSLAHVEAGILCSYSYSPFEAGKDAAHLADQILRGTTPGDLPVETTEPLSSLNMDTLSAMDHSVPDSILRRSQVLVGGPAE